MPTPRQIVHLNKLKKELREVQDALKDYELKLIQSCEHELEHRQTMDLVTKCTFCNLYFIEDKWQPITISICKHPRQKVAGSIHHGYGRYVNVIRCEQCGGYSVFGSLWSKDYPSNSHDD